MYDKGDKVVCVDDKIHPEIAFLYKQLPKKGEVYVVRDCTIGTTNVFAADQNVTFKVLLEELINDIDPYTETGCMEELGFRSDRFVPVEEISEEEEDSVLIGVGAESDKPHWL
jgi:hypothetical protein